MLLSNSELVFIMYKTVLATLSLISCSSPFIVPQETPTLLSIIYSNIPPVKLGADSRLGFGFRLGPHADFQTIIEIGPQENTKPIGPTDDAVSKRQSSKRNNAENETIDKPDQKVSTSSKRSTRRPGFFKSRPPYVGKVEFTKVPGIDDVGEPKKTKTKTAKVPKVTKFSTDAAPTKFVIL